MGNDIIMSYICIGSGIIYLVVFFLLCYFFRNDPQLDDVSAFLWPLALPLAIVGGTIFWLREIYLDWKRGVLFEQERGKSNMNLMELESRASKKGIALFFRGDEHYPIIMGCIERHSDYQMNMRTSLEEMLEKLSDWVDRYPDPKAENIWYEGKFCGKCGRVADMECRCDDPHLDDEISSGDHHRYLCDGCMTND